VFSLPQRATLPEKCKFRACQTWVQCGQDGERADGVDNFQKLFVEGLQTPGPKRKTTTATANQVDFPAKVECLVLLLVCAVAAETVPIVTLQRPLLYVHTSTIADEHGSKQAGP